MKFEKETAIEAVRVAVSAQQKKRYAEGVEPDKARAIFYADILGISGCIDTKYYAGLARIIERLNSNVFPHPVDDSFTQISSRMWKEDLGDSKQDREVIQQIKETLLDIEEGYQTYSHAMGYRMKLKLLAKLDDEERKYEHTSLEEEKNTPRHQTRRGPRSIRLDKIPNYIGIDKGAAERGTRAISEAIEVLDSGYCDVDSVLGETIRDLFNANKGRNEVISYLNRTRRNLNTAIAYANHPDHLNQVPQVFRLATNSRWTGVDFSLQKTTSLARKIVLSGHLSLIHI